MITIICTLICHIIYSPYLYYLYYPYKKGEYYDEKLDCNRILRYGDKKLLYCYQWVTLAKEIEIAGETVLVGFTTDGYCIECGIRKYDFNVSEKKINEINKKINNDILCKLNQYRNDSGAYYYWKYLDTCDDNILDKEYKKILKSVIDAFSTK